MRERRIAADLARLPLGARRGFVASLLVAAWVTVEILRSGNQDQFGDPLFLLPTVAQLPLGILRTMSRSAGRSLRRARLRLDPRGSALSHG